MYEKFLVTNVLGGIARSVLQMPKTLLSSRGHDFGVSTYQLHPPGKYLLCPTVAMAYLYLNGVLAASIESNSFESAHGLCNLRRIPEERNNDVR